VPVEDGADAFVVPDVGAGGYEERLAGLCSNVLVPECWSEGEGREWAKEGETYSNRHEAYRAL
jgi:hypothetical protein